ncbi:MAG: class I poly(R)-hydroxyalkanoic acid synthase, partial [Alphaproteobacteria bacterium]|nr:class I poly(R)-hydroxyalkanoic acid synthase [Alphaproteobacteria bacterium]
MSAARKPGDAAHGVHNDAAAAAPVLAAASRAFAAWTRQLLANPADLARAQETLWQDYLQLSRWMAERLQGRPTELVIAPSHGDRRFRDPAWAENPMFDFIKQFYLLTARWLDATVADVSVDPRTAATVRFYTHQLIDALAPTNFVLTNPEVLRATHEQRGRNLWDGLRELESDIRAGGGRPALRHVDPGAFTLGETIATTPGKVVHRSALFELIQYAPTTATVFRRPLLIVPPCINKYYVLDLRPENSFVRWAVAQGYTVFIVSWINPDERHAEVSFSDYVVQGPIEAIRAVRKATGAKRVNAVGYCIGGTLLAAALAYLAARGEDRVASATFFAAQVDFTNPGDLALFVDNQQPASLEAEMRKRGYLPGRHMAEVFNLLRANDLIWPFVINGYLLGREPKPFDMLFWNADSTRLPARMHSEYLRQLYIENRMVHPGGLRVRGIPIDLRRVGVPTYVLGMREDHIAPWTSAYVATQHFSGRNRFVLAASGHIAGVLNPPAAAKYGYWTGRTTPADPHAWLAGAREHGGSWWTDWERWLRRRSGAQVAARVPGEGALPAIEDAPGSYAKVR